MLTGGNERGDDVGHLASEIEQRLHGVAGDLEFTAAGPSLVECSLGYCVANSARFLDDGDLDVRFDEPGSLHELVAIDQLEMGEMAAYCVDERDVGRVHPQLAAVQPSVTEDWSEDVLHEAVDQFGLLHDGDGVGLADPRHAQSGFVDLTARAQQHRITIGLEQRTVQRSRLAGNELGSQRGEVSDVLVLPDQ